MEKLSLSKCCQFFASCLRAFLQMYKMCLVSRAGEEKNSEVSLLFPRFVGEERTKITVIKHLKFLQKGDEKFKQLIKFQQGKYTLDFRKMHHKAINRGEKDALGRIEENLCDLQKEGRKAEKQKPACVLSVSGIQLNGLLSWVFLEASSECQEFQSLPRPERMIKASMSVQLHVYIYIPDFLTGNLEKQVAACVDYCENILTITTETRGNSMALVNNCSFSGWYCAAGGPSGYPLGLYLYSFGTSSLTLRNGQK